MSDTNHSPVSLAAGSYDYDALKSALGVASRGSAAEYEQNVAKAIDEAGTFVHRNQDARTIPGYEFRDVEVPELGVVEKRQVFVPEGATAAADKIVDPPAGGGVTEPVEGSGEKSGDQPDEAALVTTQTRRKASAAATTTEKE